MTAKQDVPVCDCITGCCGMHNPCDSLGCLNPGCYSRPSVDGRELDLCQYHVHDFDTGKTLDLKFKLNRS